MECITKLNDKNIRILSEESKLYKTIRLNIEDVKKLYFLHIDVKFVPYEGTILSKDISKITNKITKSDVSKLKFAKEILLSLGYENPKEIKVFFDICAYWNNDGDFEYQNTLNRSISEIKIMFVDDSIK